MNSDMVPTRQPVHGNMPATANSGPRTSSGQDVLRRVRVIPRAGLHFVGFVLHLELKLMECIGVSPARYKTQAVLVPEFFLNLTKDGIQRLVFADLEHATSRLLGEPFEHLSALLQHLLTTLPHRAPTSRNIPLMQQAIDQGIRALRCGNGFFLANFAAKSTPSDRRRIALRPFTERKTSSPAR